ncbi:hypothetical protein HNR23_002153 [Nocardiopsis mwathae]|uniref:Uncharacterized protein n=1 Tax=Nocardiopsis mwathae TaxID=1472723 RepID=A0A7W9YH92_9ACTN|nr:hypothetical protein [Nocardiopsis mwathae]MBB6172093.1 hypothetical protein [Nocardiopsis mwathae]
MNRSKATATPADRPGPVRTPAARAAAAIARRWPTVLGIVLAAALAGEGSIEGGELILVVAGLTYLVTAVLDRPGAVWAVLAVLLVLGAGARLLGIEPWLALASVAIAATAVGLVRGQLRRPGLFRLQLPQALAVVTVVVAAQYGGPQLAGALVAAALIGHAVWDVVHWRADRVVARPLAEFCAVFDALLAVAIIALLIG